MAKESIWGRRISKIVTVGILSTMLTACATKAPATQEPTTQESATQTTSTQTPTTQTTVNTYEQITQDEARRLMAEETGYVILDVRTFEEFNERHIEGAICVPNETIADEEPEELPDKGQLILVYCRSGNRSKQASQKLAEMGYTNVKEFGGINTWYE